MFCFQCQEAARGTGCTVKGSGYFYERQTEYGDKGCDSCQKRFSESAGQEYKAGERFGLIRFGSRLDVYLPEGVEPQVCLGQTMVAGETVIANLGSSAAQVEGVIR